MNAFDKFDADRALRRKNSIPAWTQFRTAIEDCVNSYRRMEDGRQYPVKVDDAPDKTFIAINCDRPASSTPGMVRVTARMTVVDKKLAIVAVIDTWLLVNDAPSNQSSQEYEFLIEPDEDVRLSRDGKQLTPAEAAETVLMKALLGLPSERNNIAVVSKRGVA